jgi:hypothetical protein
LVRPPILSVAVSPSNAGGVNIFAGGATTGAKAVGFIDRRTRVRAGLKSAASPVGFIALLLTPVNLAAGTSLSRPRAVAESFFQLTTAQTGQRSTMV